MRQLVFSITKKDFDIQTFRSGGKGGQNQNKRDTGVRFIHRESGAVGEARDSRNQLRNKRSAFRRCITTKKFKDWYKLEVARRTGELAAMEHRVEKAVDEAMDPKNIKVEYV